MPDLKDSEFLIALRRRVMSTPDPSHDEALRTIAERRRLLQQDTLRSRSTLDRFPDVSGETSSV